MALAVTRAVIIASLLVSAAQFSAAVRNPRNSPPPGTSTGKFNLVFFGDSLTDTGNDLKAAGVPDPKIYYRGRFSNGPVWSNFLIQAVAKKASVKVYNYAYGGATACANAEVASAFPFVKDLTAQVAAFAADVKKKKVKVAGAKTVALQYIGSEDVLLYLKQMRATNSEISPSAVSELISATITCRVESAAALAAIRGVTDIVILPLAPVYILPAVPAEWKQQLTAAQAAASNATAMAVAQLSAQLAAVGSTVKVSVLGDTAWIANAVKRVDPPFTFLDDSCFINPNNSLTITTGIKVCKNPEEYAFYDEIHPTTRFHEWFANKGVLTRLQTAGVVP